MGVEILEIGVKMKKGAIFTIRGCFRLACNHPFLVGVLCFLLFLYRSSPFIFSLLVSASPILVCTAVLLGTLLSFGEPNIPEIEVEEKITHGALSIKSGFSGDATVVEKNESFLIERFSGEKRGLSEDSVPLIEERSREVEELNDGEVQDREFDGLMINDGNKYSAVPNDEVLGSDDEKSEADSFGSEKVNVDSLDSPPRSPWTRAEDREENEEREKQDEEDDLDDDDDSGSDRAESSSPDASMADIMPMLDELHPLLDQAAPRPAHGSHTDSDNENHDDMEVGDDDNEDGDDDNEDEDDDEQGDKEEEAKSPIKWTEEDQKNLMDLGTSEIERNQRLENLILRRRARKSMSLFPERNLIDFESVDLPFNITPITTRRQNPFDLPHDSDDNSGLPPIPGSAPSILLPRRNPFDIPYDSSEEKPDLMGDGFQEEFTTTSREPIFRRHESFNVGPSVFAPARSDARMRPYFVPERTVSRESSFSSFHRQLSGLSDSKASSVPDTESVTSVEDIMEDKTLSQEDLVEQDKEITENVGHGSESSSSEDSLQLGQEELQLGDGEDHSNSQEQRYTRDSSSSSLSEVSERVFIETDGERPLILEGRRENVADERVISTQSSLEANEIPQRYPVYDSSPRGVAPVLVKRTDSGESERTHEMLPESVISHPVVESGMIDVVSNVREDDKRDIDFLGVDQRTEDQSANQSHAPFEGQMKESASTFDDKAMDEPISKHPAEVQASTTPVEQFEVIQTRERPNMLEIQEHDHQIFSNVSTPLSPNFISIPSQINLPQSDLHTIVEETDDIKEIDEGLLSELDNVGDFSVTQWESSSNKRKDAVVECLSSSYHAETSTTTAEVIPVEENRTEDVICSETSRDFEEMKYITEQETSQAIISEHIDVPRMEFDEMDGQDSPDQETSEVPKYHDNTSGMLTTREEMPELEASTIEDIDMAFKQISAEETDKPVIVEPPKAESVAVEAITEGSETDPTYETPVLGTRQIEDDATLDYESVVMEPPRAEPPQAEPPQAELVAEAVIAEGSETDSTDETSVVEVGPIEDATSDYKPVVEAPEAELVVLEPSQAEPPVVEPHQADPIVMEPPQAELVAREFITEHSERDSAHETLVLGVSPIEDAALDFKPVVVEPPQAEQVDQEATAECSEMDPTHKTSVNEARTIDDDALDYKPAVEEPARAEPAVIERAQAEPVAREAIIEGSETHPTYETSVLEFQSIDFEPVSVDPPQAESVLLETPQADSVAREAITECSKTDPTDETSVEVRPVDNDGLGCDPVIVESPRAEPVAREPITVHFETNPTPVTPVLEIRQIEVDATLDHKPVVMEPPQHEPVILEPRQAEPIAQGAVAEHSETGPTHVTSVLEVTPTEEKVCSSVEESSETDNEDKSPEDLHSTTSVKEKGKLSKSKSKSSSSSSSSESSSSDSDKE